MSECKIDDVGNKRWYKNGELHRVDGPAIEYRYGSKVWCKDGQRHRTGGPAIEWADGDKEWWVNGKRYDEAEFILLQFTKGITVNE